MKTRQIRIAGAVFVLLLAFGSVLVAKSWFSKMFFTNQQKAEVTGKPVSAKDGDKMILEQLKVAGADLEKPREVLHYLYLPTQQASHHVARELRAQGFEVTERPSADAASHPPNPWLILARKVMIANAKSIETMRTEFEKFAKENHGDYDGWEAAAKP